MFNSYKSLLYKLFIIYDNIIIITLFIINIYFKTKCVLYQKLFKQKFYNSLYSDLFSSHFIKLKKQSKIHLTSKTCLSS